MLGSPHRDNVFGDYCEQYSAKTYSPDVGITASIRHHHPDMTLTVTPTWSADLFGFAAAGNARAELDTTDDSILRWRLCVPAPTRDCPGILQDITIFARYRYEWENLSFIVYLAQEGEQEISYILFPPDVSFSNSRHIKELINQDDESVLSNSKATDALLSAIAEAAQSAIEHTILVYDGFWSGSRSLYNEVQKTNWDDIILDDKMKKTLTGTVLRFFDSETKYREFGVPWKRGLIFYGPPGNGKTISLKALMHSLFQREDQRRVVPLYVKSVEYYYQLRQVFQLARRQAPCLLILEDIDALITEQLRSYFVSCSVVQNKYHCCSEAICVCERIRVDLQPHKARKSPGIMNTCS